MGNRKETIATDSYVHVCNRGVRKMLIYRQKSDLWRMRFNLFYLNSVYVPENWARELEKISPNAITQFVWPKEWDKRIPLTSVLAYSIMPNHFHLLLKEREEGGVSRFMHKFSMGYAKYLNTKYKESGSLFQGRFKSKTVTNDEYFRYVAVYIMVKNPMELYPKGGLAGAMKDFEAAWEWLVQYPFCSLPDYSGKRGSPIIHKELLGEVFDSPHDFKSFAKDCILGRKLDIISVDT